jgi:hypothetical protein
MYKPTDWSVGLIDQKWLTCWLIHEPTDVSDQLFDRLTD